MATAVSTAVAAATVWTAHAAAVTLTLVALDHATTRPGGSR